jgi:spore coat polysaccharide biosynthesis protein SpsF (cytidylyltransferase family)
MQSNTVIGIQARTSSKRFPKKVLAPISGKPMIEWVINRCLLIGLQVFVLISDEASDDELAHVLKNKNIDFFRGHLSDVFLRYLEFLEENEGIKKIVRINADSPLVHPDVISKVISEGEKFPDYDLITNTFPRTYPKGQSVEVISQRALKAISKVALSPHNKEHITSYFYENSADFKIHNIQNAHNLSSINLCVDEPLDLVKIQEFVKAQKLDCGLKPASWENFSKSIIESNLLK